MDWKLRGKTKETAIKIYGVFDIYRFMADYYSGSQLVSQALVHESGKRYDVMTILDQGQTIVLYFVYE